MRIAVVSDEPYPVNEFVVQLLEERGHSVVRFGSLSSGSEEPYAFVALEAARAVASGECDEGIFFCWTGTGISIAANKVSGIRAALCADAETARGARIWNHANVLALSNRWVTSDRAKEIVETWLETPSDDPRGAEAVATIRAAEARS
ncbi:MAG: RpiB/LacA/LacB family sugar-phosphate isomerase [Myxococcota bacterium]